MGDCFEGLGVYNEAWALISGCQWSWEYFALLLPTINEIFALTIMLLCFHLDKGDFYKITKLQRFFVASIFSGVFKVILCKQIILWTTEHKEIHAAVIQWNMKCRFYLFRYFTLDTKQKYETDIKGINLLLVKLLLHIECSILKR